MRAVKQAPSAPFTSSGYFIALMLVLFSASGLLTGIVMRGFAAALRPSGPGQSSTLAPADLTATANALPPVSATSFTLQLAVTPNPAKVGQAVQVSVTAMGSSATPNSTTPSATGPVQGLRCALVQTADSLALSPWPDAMTTDSAGHAQWSITVPAAASGPYTVSVRCDGAHHSWFSRYVTLSVTP